MTRRRAWNALVIGLVSAGTACIEPATPWQQNERPPTVEPGGGSAIEARAAADPQADARDSIGAADPGLPRDADNQAATREVQAFLSRVGPSDAEPQPTEAAAPPPASSTQVAGEAFGPPVARLAGRDDEALSSAAGSPNPNAGIDLNAAPTTPDRPLQEPPRIELVRVRPQAEDEADAAPPPHTMGINTSLTASDGSTDATVGQRISALRNHLVDHPGDQDAIWRLAFLLMATGREGEASDLLSDANLDPTRATVDTLGLINRLRDALQEPGPGTNEALVALEGLHRILVKDAELLVPTVALCTKVSTFGVYDEMRHEALIPYRPNRVIVYCEIRNFDAESLPDGGHRVCLASRLELLTANGDSIWIHEEPEIVDIARQRRKDFFLAQLVTFPAGMAPGEYVLKVSIEDKLATKAGEASYAFHMPSQTGQHPRF
jgi:hypothetical protein